MLVSVISSDVDKLVQPGTNSKGITCGSSPHAAMSTLMFFLYNEDGFSETSCVVECPLKDANVTLCMSTKVSTECPPPCQEAVTCEPQQIQNVTGYDTQQLLRYCVPDPESELPSQFSTTAMDTFQYEVSPRLAPKGPCCLAVSRTHPCCVANLANR